MEAIFVAPGAGAPMRAVTQAEAIAGSGLAGDRYQTGTGYYSTRPLPGGGRQLTLIAAEVLDALREETGIELKPVEARRNLTTRGIQLNDLVGARFRVGEILCEGVRLCEPCNYLEELTGKPVNRPLIHRGGLRANILSGGLIRVGDPVRAEAGTPAGGGASV